jgi:hypothetical protein
MYLIRNAWIIRSSASATAKEAVAGDPGCAQDDILKLM